MMRYTDVFRKGFNALPIRSSYVRCQLLVYAVG